MTRDNWLSKVLGYHVYEVADANDINLAVQIYHEPRSLTYAKVPAGDVAEITALEELGFRVVDVCVTLGRPPRWQWLIPGPEVQVAGPEHHKALLDIAGSCFTFSRFHLDPLVPDEDAHRIKRVWLRSYFTGERGLEVLAAMDGKRPVGFLAVLQDGNARVLDLIGVHPDSQGRGYGVKLVQAFNGMNGSRQLRVGTQAANAPSLRLFERCGFRIESSSYVLHLHRGVS